MMPLHPDAGFPAWMGFVVTLVASTLIVLTKRWHGGLTFDSFTGPQRVHQTLTPRIGGIAVFAGFWVAASMTASPIREFLFALGIGSVPAFLAGLAEDLSRSISVKLRSLAMILSGVFFCLLTGYSVTRLEIPFIDTVMKFHYISIAFTAIAIAGLANAVNLIDGFHGLAAGSVIILLVAIAVVAFSVGDHDLVMLALVIASVLLGFLLVNFPFGYVFLGDGGAYVAGFWLGALAVMLPMRNPDVSAWVSLLILGYPVQETVFSAIRKTIRQGYTLSQPDRVHLHRLVYRSYARRIGKVTGKERFSNALTGTLMWGGSMTSLLFVLLIPYTREWSIVALSLQVALYVLLYRRVALLRRRRSLPFAEQR